MFLCVCGDGLYWLVKGVFVEFFFEMFFVVVWGICILEYLDRDLRFW